MCRVCCSNATYRRVKNQAARVAVAAVLWSRFVVEVGEILRLGNSVCAKIVSYSTTAWRLHFVLLMVLHKSSQDGRFDKADRLFQSLPDAYRSCTRNPGDVKEAIPELYYLPELLVNGNGLDLGCPQSTGKPLGDVELPRWAKGDPWEFIRRHREALESEYVSARLHRWIDLVFGCRQRPPALNKGKRGAVESCNVFFHVTYPGAVDLPRLREQDPQVSLSQFILLLLTGIGLGSCVGEGSNVCEQ